MYDSAIRSDPAFEHLGSLWWMALHYLPWTLLPIALALGLRRLIQRRAQRDGRPPNLAGWIAGPAAGALAGLGIAWWNLENALRCAPEPYQKVDVCPTLFRVSATEWTLPLESALLAGGLLLGASAFTRAARAAGYAARIGAWGASLLCLAGLIEAHRVVLWAWLLSGWSLLEGGEQEARLNRYNLAIRAWDAREILLVAAPLIVALACLAARRAPARPPRRGDRLAAGIAAILLLSGVLYAWRVEQGGRRFLRAPAMLRQAPALTTSAVPGQIPPYPRFQLAPLPPLDPPPLGAPPSSPE